MKEYSIAMALADYIPVVLFVISAVILQRDFYPKMSKGLFALFACGTINIITAGALKATYKLLYAAGICDFPALSDVFMPLQSIGFLLAGLAVVFTAFRGKKNAAAAIAPPLFSGTFLFIGLMVAGLAAMLTGLSALAVRKKKGGAVALFAVAFVCSLCMGYLSSRDFEQAIYNWIAEAVNSVGQGALLAGAVVLHNAEKTEQAE